MTALAKTISIHDAKCVLLPAWFTERMLNDTWYFGLLLDTGDVIGIDRISAVTQAEDGSIWIDATMLTDPPFAKAFGREVKTAPTSRTLISINASRVVAAFELADT